MTKTTGDNPRLESESEDRPNFEKDTKYCWLALLCGFFTQVLILGVLHAFGVFFIAFIKEFKTTKGTAAWVGSIAYGLSMFVGPVTGIITKKFGHKMSMMIGGILCSIALISSSFITSINLLFFTFSCLYGVGACMSITPTMTLGQEYFDKYLSLSVGIMTSGSSLGTLIMAPTTQALIDSIGWRNTFRVYAVTCFFTTLLNLTMRPITNIKKTPYDALRTSPLRRLIAELALWKNRVFIVWTTGITLVMFGYYIPYVHLVSFAMDKGISADQGSILIMVLGASTASGRLMFGKIVQLGLLNRLHMHQLSMILSGTATMFLPLITSFPGLLIFIIVFGLVDGCFVVLLPLMTCSLVRADKVTLAWGFMICTSSITFTLGPPVAGFMYDALGSYNVPFHFAGFPVISGALILFLIPWAQRTSDVKKNMEEVEDVVVFEPDDDVDFITLSRSSLFTGSRTTIASNRHSLRYGESFSSRRTAASIKGVPEEIRNRSQRQHRYRDTDPSFNKNDEYTLEMLSISSRRTMDSESPSIALRNTWSSRRSDAINMSVSSTNKSYSRPVIKNGTTKNNVAVQTDNISMSSSNFFLPSPDDRTMCHGEVKQMSSNVNSARISRTSILESSAASGQIQPDVLEQIERLGETLCSPKRAAELMEDPSPKWVPSTVDEVNVPISQPPSASTSKTSSPREIAKSYPKNFDELLVPAESVSCALSDKSSPSTSVIERKILHQPYKTSEPLTLNNEQPGDIFPMDPLNQPTETERPRSRSGSRSPISSEQIDVTPLSTNPHNEQPKFLGNQKAFKKEEDLVSDIVPVVAKSNVSPKFSDFCKTVQGTGSVRLLSPSNISSGPSPPLSVDDIDATTSQTSIKSVSSEGNSTIDSQTEAIFTLEQTPPK